MFSSGEVFGTGKLREESQSHVRPICRRCKLQLFIRIRKEIVKRRKEGTMERWVKVNLSDGAIFSRGEKDQRKRT